MKVFLDDIRDPPNDDWIKVKNVKDAIYYLENENVEEISLDHDLGDYFETGYDVLLWIEERVVTKDFVPPKIYTHTDNPPAKKKMKMAIDQTYKKHQELKNED